MSVYDVDVLVVGSGPAGATTARYAAQGGLRVLLVDKKSELGTPVECSGALSEHALEDGGVPLDEEYILAPVYGFVTYAAGGEQIRHDYRSYGRRTALGYVVDRKRFDRYLSSLASDAGAEVWLRSKVHGYIIEDERIYARIERLGQQQTVRTRVVVGADGVMSQVALWAGLSPAVRLQDMASCLQYVVNNVETEGLLEIIVGQAHAPGGYVWVFPKGGSYAEVGLGVIRTMTKQDAHCHLERFMRESFMRERFVRANLLEVQGGGVPLAAPLKKLVASHVMLVGDAGRQVNPLTGGGLHTALRGGRLAGEYLASLGDNLVGGLEQLRGYQEQWFSRIGNDLTDLYHQRVAIFGERNVARRDALLFETLGNYFNPGSKYRKV
ncbi:MAG: digeranylgeranylglycerophospholipid reductase [Candidatus Chloroheliales bacterium]|nr:MAG: digeranylgeranylglycerophospholipid reductase [Chloroflexota bacterium]